ncbi:flavocytochrome c [Desulfospira joergensenii]|uniref:flavocytochrome c n=1 Tax=Desulfospira joergensenii TaxID=53329 RepID=UPI0003B434F6|nr:flavocytochrome c [Desulfospira joergensenii]
MTELNENNNELTRRRFLKTAGGAGALAGVAASGLFFGTKRLEAGEIPQKWDEAVDVVIIGSGFAGLAAAIEAKQAGASVVIIEKMPLPGGNSIINGGLMAGAGTPLQSKEKVDDSADLMYQDMVKAGLGLNHPDLAMMLAKHSAEAVAWTVALGAQYQERNTHLGGHSVPRSYYTTNNSGAGIVHPQLKKVKELGVPLIKKCFLDRILQDDDGRVKGVRVYEKYQFPKAGSGILKTIRANRAVILAAGGFCQDVPFRKLQDPKIDENVASTNHPGATGECLIEALRLHSNPIQLSWIQLGPWSCPHEKGMGIGYMFALSAAFPYGVMVAPKTGERFINELANRKIRADAIIKTGAWAVGIADQEGVRRVGKLDTMLERGIVKKFETLDGLAEEFKISREALRKTVAEYNADVRSGKDRVFGKPFQKDAKPLARAPFYGMHLWPKVHHTMGGVQIDTGARALDLYQKVIPGFYAAGEITGGIHGAVRLGSVAVTDCIVFGRIAGKNAAKERPWT